MKDKKNARSNRIRWIARAGIFTALSVALGYLLVFVPNIELISASIFASGWLFGSSVGITVGALSIGIFALFNPFGASLPPLLLAQVIGGMLIGCVGGILKSMLENIPAIAKGIVLGIGGGILTLVYDVLTNIGGFIAFTTEKTFLAYLAAGILFSLLHVLSNTLIFAILLFPILNRIGGLRLRGGLG